MPTWRHRITDCAELFISSTEHLVAQWVVLAHLLAFSIMIWTKPNFQWSQSLRGLAQVCYSTPSFTPAPPDVLGKTKTVSPATFCSYRASQEQSHSRTGMALSPSLNRTHMLQTRSSLSKTAHPTLLLTLYSIWFLLCFFFFFSETVILSGWHLPLPLCLLWKHKPIILPNSPDKKRYSGHIVKLNRYFLIYTDYMEISRFSAIRDEILNNKVVKIAKIETSKPGLGRWFGQ